MTTAGEIRRTPRHADGQTDQYRSRRVIEALARRDQARILVDGLTAANDLGLSNVVPTRIVVHTDARWRPIHLGSQIYLFQIDCPEQIVLGGSARHARCPGAPLAATRWEATSNASHTALP